MKKLFKKHAKKVVITFALILFLLPFSFVPPKFTSSNTDTVTAGQVAPLGMIIPNKAMALVSFNVGSTTIQITTPLDYFYQGLQNFFSWVLNLILAYTAFLLYAAGQLLDLVFTVTVLNLSHTLSTIVVIGETARIIQRMVELSIIFGIQVIAINMALGITTWGAAQALLSKLILGSLLMPFMPFFTKVMIDASNIPTIAFYTAARQVNQKPAGGGFLQSEDIADILMNALRVTTIYQNAGNSPGSAISNVVATTESLAIQATGGVVVISGATTILFSISALLILRFVTFVLLLATAPVALLGLIWRSAGGDKASTEWWANMLGQVFAGPTLCLMLLLVLTIVTSDGFKAGLYGDPTLFASTGFVAFFTNGATNGAKLVLNYVVVLALLVSSLKITQSVGGRAQGLSKALGLGGEASGGLYRNTLGNFAYRLTQNEALRDFAADNRFGAGVMKLAQRADNYSFDFNKGFQTGVKGAGEGGFEQKFDKKRDREEKFAKSLGDSEQSVARLNAAKENEKMVSGKQTAAMRTKERAERELATGRDANSKNIKTIRDNFEAFSKSKEAELAAFMTTTEAEIEKETLAAQAAEDSGDLGKASEHLDNVAALKISQTEKQESTKNEIQQAEIKRQQDIEAEDEKLKRFEARLAARTREVDDLQKELDDAKQRLEDATNNTRMGRRAHTLENDTLLFGGAKGMAYAALGIRQKDKYAEKELGVVDGQLAAYEKQLQEEQAKGALASQKSITDIKKAIEEASARREVIASKNDWGTRIREGSYAQAGATAIRPVLEKVPLSPQTPVAGKLLSKSEAGKNVLKYTGFSMLDRRTAKILKTELTKDAKTRNAESQFYDILKNIDANRSEVQNQELPQERADI